jgi:hypothetical protein
MTTTRIDVMTVEERERLREELERQVEEYKANGGKITQCPRNAYTEVSPDGRPVIKRKFSALNAPDSLNDPTKRKIGGFIPPNKREQ